MESAARLRDDKRALLELLERRGIRDKQVLDAMAEVPREEFVRTALADFAYDDSPLPIEEGQTISQPYIVALMTEAMGLQPEHKVLEIGTGSGYAAAVLSRIVKHVYTIERHQGLIHIAERRFHKLGYDNVSILHGDGTQGWLAHAPFDAIVVTAGGPEVPRSLVDQLVIGGKLVIPTGASQYLQKLWRITRTTEDKTRTEELCDVRFVPLIGKEGWSGDD